MSEGEIAEAEDRPGFIGAKQLKRMNQRIADAEATANRALARSESALARSEECSRRAFSAECEARQACKNFEAVQRYVRAAWAFARWAEIITSPSSSTK